MLYGDEMRIKQVLTNILSNAIKYTQKGSVTLFVESEQTGADEILLKMAVIDTGMGIRQDDMKYLFDSFKRVNEGKDKRNRRNRPWTFYLRPACKSDGWSDHG